MSHANEPMSSLTHALGALLSVAALVLLVVFASLNARASHIVGMAIFGSALTLLYTTSALYHFLSVGTAAKSLWHKLDHAMIFVLIAGTYTPLTLSLPARGWGWSLFGVVWGLAALGMIITLVRTRPPVAFTTVLYLIMGWLILIAFKPLLLVLSFGAWFWLGLGGALYTLGVVFFSLERFWPRRGWLGMHEIFHLFVLGGSFSHFWFMLRYVIYI